MTSKAPSSRVLSSTSLLKPLAYKVTGSRTQRRSRRSWQSRTKESGSSASILRLPSSLSVTRRAYMDEAGPEPSRGGGTRLCHYAVVHRSRGRADRHERLTERPRHPTDHMPPASSGSGSGEGRERMRRRRVPRCAMPHYHVTARHRVCTCRRNLTWTLR